jgi:hypothetical protein
LSMMEDAMAPTKRTATKKVKLTDLKVTKGGAVKGGKLPIYIK